MVCVSRMEDRDWYRNCSGTEVAQITAMLSLYKWKLTRKCPKRHYWKPGWMLFFFKFVEYDIMPGSGQNPSLVFWTDCKLCGSLLNCSVINQECHYPRQWVYTHVIPVRWTAITFFLASLSRPSSPQLFERCKKWLTCFHSLIFFFSFFFKLCIP